MPTSKTARSWQVLLLGGPAGVGKTLVSYHLARHFDVCICEVDDFRVVLERMTTPDQQPVLHFWRTHPDAERLPPEQIVDHTVAVGRVMSPAIEGVIANHLETQVPLILEGDFILPALVSQDSFAGVPNQGRVRAVFLYEQDEAQLVSNFLRREPDGGLQMKRARVSWWYGQWLKQEAERHDIIVLPSRPWDNLFHRILTAIE